MNPRTQRSMLAAGLFAGLMLPLTQAIGQEGSPAPSASPTGITSAAPACPAPASAVPASGAPPWPSPASAAPASAAPTSGSPATGAQPAVASTPVVLVDANGNAVANMVDTETLSKAVPSSFQGGVDATTGLAVLKVRATIPDAKQGQGQAYVEANAGKFFGVGDFNVTLAPEDQQPVLDLNLVTKQIGPDTTATGSLDLDVANPKGNVAGINNASLDGDTSMTGAKSGTMNLHFATQGSAVKTNLASLLKSADIKITNAQGVTTVIVSISETPASPSAAYFKQLSANPTAAGSEVQSVLESRGFNVTSVKLSNVRATGPDVGADITIVVKDFSKTVETGLRSVLASRAGALGADPALLEKSVEELMQFQVDNADLNATVADDKLDVKLMLSGTNLDKLVEGYTDLYVAAMPALQKMSGQKQTPGQQLMVQAGLVTMSRLRNVWEQAAANSNDKAQFKFSLSADVSGPRFKAKGSLDGSANLPAFLQAAKANNYPMTDSQYFLLRAKSDGKSANGTFYANATGKWFEGLKLPYVEAAKQIPELADVSPLLAGVDLSDARMSFALADAGQVTGDGYVQLANVGPLVQSAVAKNAPTFKGKVLAAHVDSESPTGTTQTTVTDLYLSGLSSGDAARADLTALGIPASVPIQSTTDTASVTPPTLTKPTVAEAPELNAVADSAEKELGVGVAGNPLFPAQGGSQTNMFLLIAGIVLVVGVAIFAMGKGSPKS